MILTEDQVKKNMDILDKMIESSGGISKEILMALTLKTVESTLNFGVCKPHYLAFISNVWEALDEVEFE